MGNTDFAFLPNAARAAKLDHQMREALATSLQHIAERANGHLDFDPMRVHAVAAELRRDRFSPAIFGRYYQLVEAIEAGEHETAQKCLNLVLAEKPLSEPFAIFRIEDEPAPGVAALYRDWMDTDPETRFDFLQPPAPLAEAFTQRLHVAIDRFEPLLPELFGEVRAIVNQVVLAVGAPDAAYQFDGGSSYRLWGALFLNPSFHPTEIDVVEVIAHEAAHSLLFGFTVDEPLELNEDHELYPSPLRVDPRPMDGIYHATFVSARMHWAMSQLIESGALTPEEREHAEAARSADEANFLAGAETVRQHARLTRTGAALFDAASRYAKVHFRSAA